MASGAFGTAASSGDQHRRTTVKISVSAPSLASGTASSSISDSQFKAGEDGRRHFKSEEKACFNTRPHASPKCERILREPSSVRACFNTRPQSMQRTILSLGGLHTLPTSKGMLWPGQLDCLASTIQDGSKDRRENGRIVKLPLEGLTSQVLEQIYPSTSDDFGFDVPSGFRLQALSTSSSFGIGSQPGDFTRSFSQKSFAESQKSPKSIRGSKSCTFGGGSTFGVGSKKTTATMKLMQFRQKMTEKFSTMEKAFGTFVGVNGYNKELTFKQFSQFLSRQFKGISADECESIFDHLDIDKNGSVSMAEFHAAIEACQPIHTIEDLRRKWISLGFQSMRKTMYLMWEPYMDNDGKPKRLSFEDFSAAISRVGINDDTEALNVFNLIVDKYDRDPKTQNTTSFDMLWGAMAAVSPYLLLEDIRDTLLRRYGGLEKAFKMVDINCDRAINSKEWIKLACTHWKLLPSEAAKAFRLIDRDHSSSISCDELIGSLRLSEPSLFLEEVRKKVRQRFRSIKEALREEAQGGSRPGSTYDRRGVRPRGAIAVNAPELPPAARKANELFDDECSQQTQHIMDSFSMEASSGKNVSFAKKSPEQLNTMLASVQLTETETKLLWDLMDVNGDGKLSPKEFDRGIEFFAPSCRLEDLRLHCLRNHSEIAEAFSALDDQARKAVMDMPGLQKVLDTLNLSDDIDVRSVFDIVERSAVPATTIPGASTECLAIAELVSALNSAAPGAQVPLPADERDAKARHKVRLQLAPFMRSATELRLECRRPQSPETAESPGPESRPQPTSPTRRGSKSTRCSQSKEKASSGISGAQFQSSGRQFKTRKIESRSNFRSDSSTKQSYRSFTQLVGHTQEGTDMVDKIRTYYTSAGGTVVDSQELLQKTQRRGQNYVTDQRHQAVLARKV